MFGADMNLAPTRPDAVLRYADHPRGIAELRLPKGKGPFPLAIIFHGGCWKTGIANQAYMSPLATRWQQLGIASLNVDYREVGDGGGWPGSFEDWAAAARLIGDVAAQYPIDRSRVTLVGHSAGALPALWLAEPQDSDGPAGQREPTRARAAIVFDGPADIGLEQSAFDALCEFSSVAPFMGGTHADQSARFAAIAPAQHAPKLEQVLFVNAVLPPPPESALAALRAGGAKVKVLERRGASHFEIITPGSDTYRAIEPALLNILRGP
jgi:pimeloyl-ACP methyl ester carboxylesterase